MANKIMKTLTIGGNTYEVYDEVARGAVSELSGQIGDISKLSAYGTNIAEILLTLISDGDITPDVPDEPVLSGEIDENNNITINGLPTGTYLLRYENDYGVLNGYDKIAILEVQ